MCFIIASYIQISQIQIQINQIVKFNTFQPSKQSSQTPGFDLFYLTAALLMNSLFINQSYQANQA